MKTTTYEGVQAYRRDGKIVLEIPESVVLADAHDPLHPADPSYEVLDQEHFLHELAQRLTLSETDRDDYPQSRVRALVRDVIHEIADAGLSAQHPPEFQPADEFRRAS